MKLPDIFSRRKRLASQAQPEIYSYDRAPDKLKMQIVQIIQEGFGPTQTHFGRDLPAQECYEALVRIIRKEQGISRLTDHSNEIDELFNWILQTKNIEDFLDAVEICLKMIDRHVRDEWFEFSGISISNPDDVIDEFNARCQEAAFGYQFVGGIMVRIDSQIIHKEIVLPALRLLSDPRFKSADEEYRDAHEAYRRGDYKDCLVGCGRAFESILKVIGHKRAWIFSENDPASKLIAAGAAGGFIAAHSQASLNHLQGLLASSIPAVRNKLGGHGAGVTPHVVPPELCALQLHQTAAVILFLVEHDKSTP